MKNNKYKITYLKDYAPSPFLIEAADLHFMLDPKATIVKATLQIKRNPEAAKKRSITLDGINLALQQITLNHQPLPKKRYSVTSTHLTIMEVPEAFVLETIVKLHPTTNLSCTGLYLTNNNFCTQNEPHGFRHITYFIDRPDILTKFSTTITADKDQYPVLLSNGNLLATKQLANNQHQASWHDPFPKSAYLFALVAGKFAWLEDYYTTHSGRKITLRIFAEPQQLYQCQHAMFCLKQAMAWEEQNFRLEYDLDLYQIVAINDLNFGAMENKGLNIFNSKLLLASPLTATDNDFKNVAAVIAHEYFHNWTGNRVTCRDWFQIGLKEGLTTLREQLFMEDTYGTINRIDTTKTIYTKQFAEDAGPLAHPIRLQSYIDVNNFYTTTVYYKSAEVARMLITLFGKRVFQKIMQKFLATFDGQAVTIEDFLQVAAYVTKMNLKQFKLWYDQCGTPVLKITDQITKNKTYTLTIKQEHPKAPQDFFIPLAYGLLKDTHPTTPAKILIINKQAQKFSFKNFATKPIPTLLRNFSAPVKVDYAYNKQQLLFLIKQEQDPINRWNASHKLLTTSILELYHQKHTNKDWPLPTELVEMVQTIITDKQIDPSLAAHMLTFPSIGYLLEILPRSDINKLYVLSESIKTSLAKALTQELLACYNNSNIQEPYNLSSLAIGKRELKNTCLYYLMHLNTQQVFALGKKQLTKADNLTDIYASLMTLANSSYAKREQILERYYHKWRNQPNLVNKWLMLNASIKLPGTLKRVKQLLTHPGFNLTNPNNVYALLRTFFEQNLNNFHALNGAGYKFLAKQIITIDKFNPQLAASLAIALTQGYKVDNKRQKLMHQELRRINKTPKLSANVYEITAKAIGVK